ncbi:MAG: segregation/condensation protein A, partial [Ectothiorhodospiraceae bacterium]|nr:segregation/condensation protein A [Ectothiorhodospiraceae bacterium]
VFQVSAKAPNLKLVKPEPELDMRELLSAFKDVLVRLELNSHHKITSEPLSLRERMSDVLEQLKSDKFIEFTALFPSDEGRMGLVVTFLAVLELIKESLIEIIQTGAYEPIHVKTRTTEIVSEV